MAAAAHVNQAGKYATKIMRSESAVGDPLLQQDYQLLVKGHAIYHKEFFCGRHDFSILTNLCKELDARGEGLINWSQHFKHENPDFSPTFQKVVDTLSEYFNLDVYATRLNFYPDNSSWKPFHHDSHAYGGRKLREDLTVGASFGATRSLVFKHDATGHQFGFPQQNGDCFAFTTKVNTQFQHGVPKEAQVRAGPRFSIIAWGRRRTIDARNGGADEVGTRDFVEVADDRAERIDSRIREVGAAGSFQAIDDAPIETDESEAAVEIKDVTRLVESFVLRETHQRARVADSKASNSSETSKRRKGRVQGGWGGGGAKQGGRGRGGEGGGGRTGRGGRGGRGRGGRGQGSRSRSNDSSSSHPAARPAALEPSYSDDDE